MKKIKSTFQMNGDKVKQLKRLGFDMDEIIILKEELGKAKARSVK